MMDVFFTQHTTRGICMCYGKVKYREKGRISVENMIPAILEVVGETVIY
jgi:hypothetical protein